MVRRLMLLVSVLVALPLLAAASAAASAPPFSEVAGSPFAAGGGSVS